MSEIMIESLSFVTFDVRLCCVSTYNSPPPNTASCQQMLEHVHSRQNSQFAPDAVDDQHSEFQVSKTTSQIPLHFGLAELMTL